MKIRRLAPLALAPVFALSFCLGCAEDQPPPPAAPPPPPAPVVVTAAEPPPPPAPVLTPEQKKAAADLEKLNADRAKFETDSKAELARWTPEMRAAAAALAGKTYATGHAAIVAAMAGPYRRPGDAARDKYRHPAQTLDFLGFRPNMKVIEVGPGEGWYTELLAPALAKQGKLIVTMSDPNGPADQRSTFNGQKFKALLDSSPELYGRVQPVVVDGKAPLLPYDGTADMVLLMREVHGMYNSKVLEPWLAQAYRALKPGGVLGVVEHRAAVGASPDDTSKKGYVAEKWVIDTVTAAGFKLAGKSEINANPKDTKDYPEGVWSLPPSFQEKTVNHDTYAAIGESDRMTLKFVKVAAKK